MKPSADNVSLETIQALYDLLVRGDLPEGVEMESLPTFTPRQAFALIWYLQEIAEVLPDNVEQCHRCEELFDSRYGICIVGDGTFPHDEPLYLALGVTEAEIKAHAETIFCSSECEAAFWSTEHAQP